MRLCNKKVHCSSCGGLVRCKEQKTNGGAKVSCARCGRTLYVLEGGSWRPARETA